MVIGVKCYWAARSKLCQCCACLSREVRFFRFKRGRVSAKHTIDKLVWWSQVWGRERISGCFKAFVPGVLYYCTDSWWGGMLLSTVLSASCCEDKWEGRRFPSGGDRFGDEVAACGDTKGLILGTLKFIPWGCGKLEWPKRRRIICYWAAYCFFFPQLLPFNAFITMIRALRHAENLLVTVLFDWLYI